MTEPSSELEIPLSSEEKERQALREDHFIKVLRNFVALSSQVQDFMRDQKTGEISEETKLALNRITEGGMWFRMSMDLERASRIQGAKLMIKPKEGDGSGSRESQRVLQ